MSAKNWVQLGGGGLSVQRLPSRQPRVGEGEVGLPAHLVAVEEDVHVQRSRRVAQAAHASLLLGRLQGGAQERLRTE